MIKYSGLICPLGIQEDGQEITKEALDNIVKTTNLEDIVVSFGFSNELTKEGKQGKVTKLYVDNKGLNAEVELADDFVDKLKGRYNNDCCFSVGISGEVKKEENVKYPIGKETYERVIDLDLWGLSVVDNPTDHRSRIFKED